MDDGEGFDGELLRLKGDARLQVHQVNGHRRALAAQHDAVDQILHPVKGVTAAPDFQRVDALPAHEGGEQPGQAKDVIQVAVREQDTVQALEADAALEQLALRAFAAVYQKAILPGQDDLGRQPAQDRRRGRGSPQKDQLEHVLS